MNWQDLPGWLPHAGGAELAMGELSGQWGRFAWLQSGGHTGLLHLQDGLAGLLVCLAGVVTVEHSQGGGGSKLQPGKSIELGTDVLFRVWSPAGEALVLILFSGDPAGRLDMTLPPGVERPARRPRPNEK